MPLHSARILSLTLVFAGCGLTTQEFEGKVKVNVSLNDPANTYDSTIEVDTNENADIRDNRDRIHEGSGSVREITFEVINVGTDNQARYCGGDVFLREAQAGEWPDEPRENADGLFDSVPITMGQRFRLDLSPAKRDRIAKLVFDKPQLQAKVRGRCDPSGPVAFDVQVTFVIEFEAGL